MLTTSIVLREDLGFMDEECEFHGWVDEVCSQHYMDEFQVRFVI